MTQTPECGAHLLFWQGDALDVSLALGARRAGKAFFRTDLGGAAVRRREIIDANDRGLTPLEKAWRDVPMEEASPGVWTCRVPLDEVGVFSGKCCFFPNGGGVPEWPEGGNVHIKVEPAETRGGNSIYTVFPRQFGSFREVARRLDFIMDEMGFDIIQTLPVFPVPTTYAVMGEYGCPFAALDFFSVDPAMAEFDTSATPLDQFRELIGAVHAKGGRLFVDLPANHTGWASTLQTHHPDWFRRRDDGEFVSPGAWGVTWADLVELDYSHPELRAYMAEVFLFWVRNGVDGFRCDAGYMIPEKTWEYIVARVREEYPDTVFMLEGLGGKIEVTDSLLSRAGLDWAYSEIFQTYDRGAFEWYFPGAADRSRRLGTLVHFAETHDNDRLAKGGKAWARLRVAIAALLSHQGAWGIANGVEWYATEKIDVHGKNDLNWGADDNMVPLIARLNAILRTHPDFAGNGEIKLVERGEGNFLAVLRGETLILANLDCSKGVEAHWDMAKFHAGECHDLIEDRPTTIVDGTWLEPGEFRCVSRAATCGESGVRSLPCAATASLPSIFWRYPEDLGRIVCVPAGRVLKVVSPHPFRARLNEGEMTLSVARGAAEGDAFAATLVPPQYSGDGTRGDVHELVVSVYAPDGVERRHAKVLFAPPAEAARVKLEWSGAEIRDDSSLETILSNGAGASARVKLAWGEIASQYDALFAANTNPRVPADRLVLWTRCRAWLQYEGYSREFNKDCIESFRADPAGREARWRFRVPCGMGRTAEFEFCLFLAQDGVNTAKLMVWRTGGDAPGAMRIVFRPDLEWRSFHSTTKAQGAVERAFAGAAKAVGGKGFRFRPYGTGEEFDFAVSDGTCHIEPQWTYSVSHSEEAERGQEPCGDLYSPAWFACDFANVGDEVVLSGAYMKLKGLKGDVARAEAHGRKNIRVLPMSTVAANVVKVADALKEALKLFIVRRDDVKTVIAGYPWFLDWGRDTFIFLRGAISAGFVKEAREIVTAFARFEENGTLPNIIHGETAGNRDTTDAQLWFIVAVRDLCAKLGRKKMLAVDCGGGRTLKDVVESIAENYLKGTPNGIRVDEASGLVWSPSHFTWMDTNYPACTPRIGYPVEIQALWIAALRFLGGKRWNALADKAADSLVRFFSNGNGLADCLDAPNGEPAATARRDDAVRPNQLFAISLGAVAPDGELAREIVRACAQLVVPGGVRSLASGDVRYRGRYTGDEDTSRKQAYHNGTVWAWPFPMFAEAAAACGELSRDEALSLLATAVDNINAGCVCQMSEIADGDAPHEQKGCRAQAWSASEALRVWLALGASA
jgi:predicted glycogen debranching enzyme